MDEASGRAALRPLLSRARHLEHVDDLDVEPSRVRWQAETDVAAARGRILRHLGGLLMPTPAVIVIRP